MKRIILSLCMTMIFVVASLSSRAAYAQERNAIPDSIYSKILKEERSIKVLLPSGYKPGSNEKYDVIYVTDGEWTMDPFSFVYGWAKGENFVPPAIIVSIPNKRINKKNQRARDFLPVHVPEPAISGGAGNFLSFIKDELIPYVDSKYPTDGSNSIYGHSYGGLFVLYALLTDPQLFESYYATDPPFEWDNDYLIKMASEKLNNLPPGKVLWIAGRSENRDIGRLDSVLQLKAPKTLHWKVITYRNETHNSMRLKAMYDGIKFAYAGYSNSPLVFHPMNGILLKGKPTPIFIMGGSFRELRYTVDGSEPVRTSPEVGQQFTITGPAHLVVKSFSTTGKYDKTARGNFELGNALPSVAKPEKVGSGGLKYSYYEGDWEKLPDFMKLKPVRTGVADSAFKITDLPRKSNFACVFDGYIRIVKEGYYIFGLVSKDGSTLYLGDRLIIDNDGVHPDVSIKSFVLPLEKGFYPIRIEYFQKGEGDVFQLLYLNPETHESPGAIPFRYQYFED